MNGFGDYLLLSILFFGLFTSLLFLYLYIKYNSYLKNPKSANKPKVTIMVPVYNAETTMQVTVESLLNLDYPKNKLEILIINDGSTDSTPLIAKEYAQKYFNIKTYTKKNGGKGRALNYGIKRATGEFCGALDADSFVLPDALSKMVGYFSKKNIMAVTPSMKIHEPKCMLQSIQQIEYLIGVFLRKAFAFLGSIHVTPGPFTIYRKSFFEKYGGYAEENATEDIEVALRIQSKGFQIENSVDAVVYTIGPSKFMPLLKQRIRWYRGFLDNLWDYKTLFGAKQGNLGLFILPGSIISVGLVIVTIAYSLIKTSMRWYEHTQNFINVGFDIFKTLDFKLDFFFVRLDALTMLTIITLFLGIAIIITAKKISNEKTNVKFSYLYYMIIYIPLFAFWWTIAIYYKLFNKKILWGARYV